jgi:thiol:disulfide interchange protein DsbA
MKYLSIVVAALAILIAGWIFVSGREQAPEPVMAPAETAVEAIAETIAVEPPPADDAGEQELVEESSGDEEEAQEDQPIILAQADTSMEERDWTFSEGTHFSRMVPAQPTVGGAEKIEVAEFFWYGCNHCFDFEPYVKRWAEGIPANVRFVQVPALWNPLVKLHGQLFYTEEVLATNGKLVDRDGFRNAVFLEIHRRGNRLASDSAIYEVFGRFGVAEEDFKATWGSFEVAQKMQVAEDLSRRYGLTSVPMVVVNGKYKTSAGEAGSYPKLLELVDELIEREELLR